MNLGKYIQQLLLENETVIVPGFGAFISKYKPAEIIDGSDEITPPTKTVLFDSKIKSNDGLLAREVSQKEQIPFQKALKKIEEEREEIFYRLDKGEKVNLEKIGTLFYNENREIEFEFSGTKNLLLDSFGLEVTSKKDLQEVQTEKNHTEIPIVDSSEEKTLQQEPEVNEDDSKKPESAVTRKAVTTPVEESPKKKKRGWLWLLLLFIPLIGGGIFFLINQKPVEKSEPEIRIEPPKAEETILAAADTVTADSAAVLPADTLKTTDETFMMPAIIEPDTTKFYLIGGSFQDGENAEKYVQKMKEKGYEPFHLGKHGSYFLVGLETHNNEIEAYGAQYNFLDKFPDSGVWVFIPK